MMDHPSRLAVLLAVLSAPLAHADDDSLARFEPVAKDFAASARPILAKYCLGCHSTEESQGELDLERFATLDQVRRAPGVWLKVVEMLDNGEMPPKKKPQPSAVERRRLRDWAKGYLELEARSSAGDPGAVVLRRLSNVEYDNTIRDLTGVDLKPAREFPVDGAAGEGFTNVGEALAMSPAMLDKYVAAAKRIADHAVLLPDTFRFSESATRRDWTNDLVGRIKDVYRKYTDPSGSTRVNLQGLVWDTNSGGRVPLEAYLTATLAYRHLPMAGRPTVEAFANDRGFSPKYLRIVWDLLNARDDSPLIGRIRSRWVAAKAGDVPAIAAEIRSWQAALTKFNSVAHFKPWMEPVNPLAGSTEIRLKLAASPEAKEIVVHLATRDAGDGPEADHVEWRGARLEMPGRAPIALRDLRDGLRGLLEKRKTLADAAKYLDAVEVARSRPLPIDVAAIASEKGLDPRMLEAWCGYLGVVGRGSLKVEGLFTSKIENVGNNGFVSGWGTPDTPNVVANASGEDVHVPGLIKPHGVAMHPAPNRNVAVGWLSPVSGAVRVEPKAVHAHPACGNGVSWSLELRRDGERRRIDGGDLNVGGSSKPATIPTLRVQKGDLVSLVIGPRGANHACDLTEVNLAIVETDGAKRAWNLAADASGSILRSNPLADSFGNAAVWHFYTEPAATDDGQYAAIPYGSLLDRWRDETDRAARVRIALQLQDLLRSPTPAPASAPDTLLYQQLNSLSGPLLGKIDFARLAAETVAADVAATHGLPRSMFGRHPKGQPVEPTSLVTAAPSVVEVRLPSEIASGREFVVTARTAGGTAQAVATVGPPPPVASLLPDVPILVAEGEARSKFVAAFDAFRRVFPAALCYPQVVPVDEVITLVLFHREDEGLSRLMLDDAEHARLDRLWDELRYVSQDVLRIQEAYGQFMEYVSQDGDVRVFEPLRKPINGRAEAFRKRLVATEPNHLDALVAFAGRAYRRPLTPAEGAGLRDLYAQIRSRKLPHDAAFRLTLARVLMGPSFLYRAETPATGKESRPVSDWELASRLSYFLWSSMPDDELRGLAASGKLSDPKVLADQTKRMLRDPKARSLATEFACQWLDIRGFDEHNEKSEQAFPQFAALRGAMYEESVRFFADLFSRNGSIFEVLDADHTFVNGPLAKHYDIPGVDGPEWRRVEGVKARHRGGILGMATLLAKQSGASRTSPVLRGNWLSETLLGERLPRPPKNVPQLPESELDTNGLTMRQMTEKHRAIESCAKCHDRIDPFGFALEGFDAIGKRRSVDLGGRPIDAKAELKDGTKFDDIEGLRRYLLTTRRDEFVGHYCRKLLGYSLARSVQLSDGPLLDAMKDALDRDGGRVESAILKVVASPQFRNRRGLESPLDRVDANP